MKKIQLHFFALVFALLLTGCGAGSGKSHAGSAAPGEQYESAQDTADGGWSSNQSTAGEGTAPSSPALQNAKIILQGEMDLQSQAFDEADAFLRTLTADLGGYLESTSINGETGYRYAAYTVRIPQKQYDSFFAQVGEKCHVLSSSSQAQNITEEYVDLEVRLASQRTKHARLLALLEKADSMETIIALQTELANTEYEIERMTGSLRRYDSLVDFSTVSLTLSEVRALDPVADGNSFGKQLTQSFRQGASGFLSLVQGVILFAVMLSPFFITLLVIAVVLIVISRRIYRKKAEKAKLPENEQKHD